MKKTIKNNRKSRKLFIEDLGRVAGGSAAQYTTMALGEEGYPGDDDVTTMESTSPEVVPRALTWKGHEFLDLARDQKRWTQAKGIVGKIGSAPISVWMKVLNDLVLKELDLAT